MEEDRFHIIRRFIRPANKCGLYPESKGEERRDVTRYAFTVDILLIIRDCFYGDLTHL